MVNKNPVQKNLWKFNKKKVHEDKTKYQRKDKHANQADAKKSADNDQ